jgi:hypothetical protein
MPGTFSISDATGTLFRLTIALQPQASNVNSPANRLRVLMLPLIVGALE